MPPEIRAVQGQVISRGRSRQPQRALHSQISQHATTAKARLTRTAGQTRFDNLASCAEKLPECTLFKLSQLSEAAVLIFAILARL
jgi:hypothetical protein